MNHHDYHADGNAAVDILHLNGHRSCGLLELDAVSRAVVKQYGKKHKTYLLLYFSIKHHLFGGLYRANRRKEYTHRVKNLLTVNKRLCVADNTVYKCINNS